MNARLGWSTLLLFCLTSACAAADEACECVACTNAVTLSVFDENLEPVSSFWVEATANGEAVEDMTPCDDGIRTANACAFGTELGTYNIIVHADGFLDHESAARFAARPGNDCCRCLSNTLLDVFLVPATTP